MSDILYSVLLVNAKIRLINSKLFAPKFYFTAIEDLHKIVLNVNAILQSNRWQILGWQVVSNCVLYTVAISMNIILFGFYRPHIDDKCGATIIQSLIDIIELFEPKINARTYRDDIEDYAFECLQSYIAEIFRVQCSGYGRTLFQYYLSPHALGKFNEILLAMEITAPNDIVFKTNIVHSLSMKTATLLYNGENSTRALELFEIDIKKQNPDCRWCGRKYIYSLFKWHLGILNCCNCIMCIKCVVEVINKGLRNCLVCGNRFTIIESSQYKFATLSWERYLLLEKPRKRKSRLNRFQFSKDFMRENSKILPVITETEEDSQKEHLNQNVARLSVLSSKQRNEDFAVKKSNLIRRHASSLKRLSVEYESKFIIKISHAFMQKDSLEQLLRSDNEALIRSINEIVTTFRAVIYRHTDENELEVLLRDLRDISEVDQTLDQKYEQVEKELNEVYSQYEKADDAEFVNLLCPTLS